MIHNTSRYPAPEVRAIVNFAAGSIDTADVVINVKNSSSAYAGRAYNHIPYQSPYAAKRMYRGHKLRYLITARIGKPDAFPRDSGFKYIWRKLAPGEPYESNQVRSRMKMENGVERRWLEKWHKVPYGGTRGPLQIVQDWREAMVWLVAHELMHIQQYRFNAKHSEFECEKYAEARMLAWRGREEAAVAACGKVCAL